MGREAPPEVIEFVRRAKQRFRVERVILFGSRARGDFLEHSDYDVIVVSKDFEGVPFYARPIPLLRLWDVERDLELLCYTPEEFETKRRGINIVSTAVAEGTDVAA